MTTINKLTAVDAVVSGDQIPVYSSSNGDARKAAMSVLLAYMQSNIDLSAKQEYTTQYAAPSATGFNIQVTDGDDNIHLILTPVAGYAAGTITLPAVANCVDKQEVLVNCTQSVSTLTVAGNGATAVTGEPASLSANDFFKLRYDASTSTWYRVG
jgi:hypothetical protein